ncbi:MAG TPA: AMP-binding protein [Deferrisomatales bacterium]|nr:AMP-binding protein [Deferrisomatales bacterium]
MIKSMNAAWWVERWSELTPNKCAVLFEGQVTTYRDLQRRADQTACWLQSLGVEKGDRVAVLLHNCPEFLDLYLSCARLGAIFVPLNFRLQAPELRYLLGNCRPRLFVFDGQYQSKLGELALVDRRSPMLLAAVGECAAGTPGQRIHPMGEREEFEGEKPFLTSSLAPSDPEEPHVIMYTSGTTGDPKGAVLSHRKTFFNCLNADIFFQLQSDDVMLVVLPLFHSGGLFIQASPVLYKGATMLLHPRFDPVRVYRDIEEAGVTKFLAVPTVCRAMLQVPPSERASLASLRVAAVGGEKTTVELLAECREAGFSLRQVMGQTETSILLWASEEDALSRPGTLGKPVFHAEVRLVDSAGSVVPPGAVGEIVARGSILMKEYWQDPERTEHTLRGGWLHTGDLARRDGDGYFYFVDRQKDLYISGGENVYPAEVERVLRAHPAVQDAAVVGVPDPSWGEVGHAYVIACPGCEPGEEELRAFCQGQLAKFKIPARFSFCREFPLTALGKVRKHDLARTPADR